MYRRVCGASSLRQTRQLLQNMALHRPVAEELAKSLVNGLVTGTVYGGFTPTSVRTANRVASPIPVTRPPFASSNSNPSRQVGAILPDANHKNIPIQTDTTAYSQKYLAGNYRPKQRLPKDKNGNKIPDTEVPHTQLSTKKSSKGNYTQAREWGYDGDGKLKPARDIDFTDHGRPQNHTNPHQHDWKQNPTGGSLIRGDEKPLEWP